MRFQPKTIAVVGGSGSGKTWLLERLRRVFGDVMATLSLDDFYQDRSHLPVLRRAQLNFDHPRAIDWRLFKSVLDRGRAGQVAQVPSYSFSNHARLPGQERWSPAPLILCDGLWLFHRPSLRGLFDLKIFLECPTQLRLERRLERDTAERGRSKASVREQFWKTVTPMHDQFVAPQARWADLILHQPSSESEISMLVERLRALIDQSRPSAPQDSPRATNRIGEGSGSEARASWSDRFSVANFSRMNPSLV